MHPYKLNPDGTTEQADDHDKTIWKNRRIDYTEVGGVGVSTVFLIYDHNYTGSGAPILFETRVFGGPMDGECVRYTTKAEAMMGHLDMVLRVKTGEV